MSHFVVGLMDPCLFVENVIDMTISQLNFDTPEMWQQHNVAWFSESTTYVHMLENPGKIGLLPVALWSNGVTTSRNWEQTVVWQKQESIV